MKRAKQPFLPGFEDLGDEEFGGDRTKGNPRKQRPISTRRAIHLVMRSSRARGDRSLRHEGRAAKIERLIHRQGRRSGVKVYDLAVNENHLHLLIRPRSRKAYASFIRAISGLIARLALGAERGRARQVKFWDARPFTRIIEWGRDFRAVCRYVSENTLEAIGFIAYRARGRRPKRRRAGSPGPSPPLIPSPGSLNDP